VRAISSSCRELFRGQQSDNKPRTSDNTSMGKEEFTSPPASERRRVTPSIRKRNRGRRQEELIDQPRRSKRSKKFSNSSSIPVTPAPSSSIRDSARTPSISGSGGSRKYTGSKYSLEEALTKRAPSSPQERGHANATTEKQGDETTAVNDGPRHCYCDEYCQGCTSITPCETTS
jgi:hypothetical protein